MSRRWTVLLLGLLSIFGVVRPAHADASTAHTVSVAVLALDSDDVEDHAEALSIAIRSRIRASQGWSLLETSQSLAMLTPALRCPSKPLTPDCQQKVGEHIKSDRFIYGYVTKGPAAQVTAELHFYQKGKPDTVVKETYSDNLKDSSDDALRRVAQRILDRLAGTTLGVIVVHYGTENGEVIVDGDKRVPLQNGQAKVELSPGGHSVELAIAGQPPQKRNILVTAGKETSIDLAIVPVAVQPEKPKDESSFPTRKVVGGALVAAGVVGAVLAVVNFSKYSEDQDQAETVQASTNSQDRKLPAGKDADDACGNELTDKDKICQLNSDARRHSLIAGVSAGLGGLVLLAGAYFLFTEGGDSKGKAAQLKPRLTPSIGLNSGGLSLSGRF